MLPDKPVPLADNSPGCSLESRQRLVQDDVDVYWVSLNRDWLSQLGIAEQASPTVHSLATRPVTIQNPAIIIQPARVLDE